jgi:GNAT superfamily N-acetyltransferase
MIRRKTKENTKSLVDVDALIAPFAKVVKHQRDEGYIAWRLGSGNNAELLFIHAYDRRKGVGRSLLITMLNCLCPCVSDTVVYGFVRAENEDAIAFYRAMGFELTEVKGVYGDGTAVVFSQSFEVLSEKHCVRSDK